MDDIFFKVYRNMYIKNIIDTYILWDNVSFFNKSANRDIAIISNEFSMYFFRGLLINHLNNIRNLFLSSLFFLEQSTNINIKNISSIIIVNKILYGDNFLTSHHQEDMVNNVLCFSYITRKKVDGAYIRRNILPLNIGAYGNLKESFPLPVNESSYFPSLLRRKKCQDNKHLEIINAIKHSSHDIPVDRNVDINKLIENKIYINHMTFSPLIYSSMTKDKCYLPIDLNVVDYNIKDFCRFNSIKYYDPNINKSLSSENINNYLWNNNSNNNILTRNEIFKEFYCDMEDSLDYYLSYMTAEDRPITRSDNKDERISIVKSLESRVNLLLVGICKKYSQVNGMNIVDSLSRIIDNSYHLRKVILNLIIRIFTVYDYHYNNNRIETEDFHKIEEAYFYYTNENRKDILSELLNNKYKSLNDLLIAKNKE